VVVEVGNFTYGTASTHARSIGTLPVRLPPNLVVDVLRREARRDELDRDRPLVVAVPREVQR